MDKLATTEVLRKIAMGEVDLDEISEVLRSADLVIKSYQAEIGGLRRTEEELRQDFEEEKKAVDELTRRMATLHEENRMAREVFRTEIEGKWQVLGIDSLLDLEALTMEGLIRERENVQRHMGKALGSGGKANARPVKSLR